MGTPDFAVGPLEKIVEKGHDVCAVFSQPDKPKGRHFTLVPTPVKAAGEKYGIPVYQPTTFKDNDEIYEIIKNLAPDCIVVAAYGRILPERILSIPPKGCINIHASLLPKYRGSAPIQRAIISGDEYTGITTMYMAKGMDTGDIIDCASVPIEHMDAQQLHDKLSFVGAELIIKTLDKIEDGSIVRIPQCESEATYAPMITKEDGRVDFNKTSEEIDHLVRGVYPWPGAVIEYKGKKIKILKAKPVYGYKGRPGQLLDLKRLIVACADETAIELVEVTPEGSKKMLGEQFLMGKRCSIGEIFEGVK